MFALARRIIRPAIGSVIVLGSGCYSYSGAAMETVRVGQPVRARISGAQAERLEPVLGNVGRLVEGQLLEKGDSALTIAVATPVSTEGSVTLSRAYQRIVIQRGDLQELEVRHLDRGRTSLALLGAAVGVAAAAATVSQVIQLGESGSRSNTNKSRAPLPIPIFQLRLSR